MSPVPAVHHEDQQFDLPTFVHYLIFRNTCYECSGTEFQSLFEGIVQKTRPDFMQIKPYGPIGDKKCDGLFFADGHVFQVYSPDEYKQSALIKKINEDLDGAVKHWRKRMKSWTFVYNNIRRGLPPDVPDLLYEKKEKYSRINLDSWSADTLWEMVRTLPIQKRAEILGPVPGFYSLNPSLTGGVHKALKNGWIVIIHDVMTPINVQDALKAMRPSLPLGAPFHIAPYTGALPWDEAAAYQKAVVENLIEQSRSLIPRFAVFCLSPIPLCIHLGFLLSDRVQVECFQYDRDHKTWNWPELKKGWPNVSLKVSGLPKSPILERCEIMIRVSLSAAVSGKSTQEAAGNLPVQVDISVSKPDVMWLRSPEQLVVIGKVFRDVLATIREKVPNCRRMHLFYAGPTGGAVVIGQAINPRMNPPVVLYEYSQQTTPNHRQALILTA